MYKKGFNIENAWIIGKFVLSRFRAFTHSCFRAFAFLFIFPALAHAQIDIRTTYSEKTYVTVAKTTVNASLRDADRTLDQFIDDLISDPMSLFADGNIFDGLGSKDEKEKDMFFVAYKDSYYHPETKLYSGTLDIYMYKTKLSNINFTGKISRTFPHENVSEAHFELVDNNPFIKVAKGKIVVKQIDAQTIEIEQTAIFQFRWLFNIFFTQNNYKNIAEWRLDKLLHNLKQVISNEF